MRTRPGMSSTCPGPSSKRWRCEGRACWLPSSSENGSKGRLSLQTNPVNYTSSDRMLEQALRFNAMAPNMQVKFPATAAGILGMEQATAKGVNVNATVCFTVAQATAVAEAVERGLEQREREGNDPALMKPVCTIMVGRLDDWMKVLVERDDIAVDPTVLSSAGIAAFKRAYEIFQVTWIPCPVARRRLSAPFALDRVGRRGRHLDHAPSMAGDVQQQRH